MELVMKKVVFCILMVLFFASSGGAVLLPDAQEQLQSSYLKTSDVEAILSQVGIKTELSCVWKAIFKTTCQCTAVYRVDDVLKSPSALGIQPNDLLNLSYPCDSQKNITWSGSRVPWVSLRDDGTLRMVVPSHYLRKQAPHRWSINNQTKIFSPLISTSKKE
jgi:hypothetical protein